MLVWVADVLVVIGLLVMTIGVVGIYRMPTVYLQLHAASKAVFLGVIMFVLASFATLDGQVIGKGTLIIVFLLITTPLSAHLIARAAHLTDRGKHGRE